MTFSGPDASAPGQQPATPDNAQGASQATPSQATPQKSGAKKWLPIAGSVAVAGVLGAGSLTGWFGIGDPKVGDCVQMASETDFDVVDCGADEAEMKIVGIDEQEMTRAEFDAAGVDEICADFATTEAALWIGDVMTDPGSIYCAASI
jgi:hypothetical protein